jgi:hypothetical protein
MQEDMFDTFAMREKHSFANIGCQEGRGLDY